MGRPKGSKNGKKSHKEVVKEIKEAKEIKKRGRPKKEVVVKKEEVIESNLTTVKFLGYCKCKFMISKLDIDGEEYTCPSCGKSGKISILKQDINEQDKVEKAFKSQKEYLSYTVNSDHYESLGYNDHDISPKDLKVKDI